jgi:gamma-glutamyltranspeptidase/glutathione hydrolase
MWTNDGELRMILGTRGGHQQPQLLAQVAANVLVLGDDPDKAQSRPRWAMNEFGAGTSSSIGVEPGHVGSAALGSFGHDVRTVDGPQRGWGPVSLITIDDTGLRRGAADPRVDTASGAVR